MLCGIGPVRLASRGDRGARCATCQARSPPVEQASSRRRAFGAGRLVPLEADERVRRFPPAARVALGQARIAPAGGASWKPVDREAVSRPAEPLVGANTPARRTASVAGGRGNCRPYRAATTRV